METTPLESARVEENKSYRVWLHAPKGKWALYHGSVDVSAMDERSAVEKAKDQLNDRSFPDGPRKDWIVDRVEHLP